MTLYQKQNPDSIRSLFNSIAHAYDRANGIMSLQLHQVWNRNLIRKQILPAKPKILLDLCAGTGEIGLGYLRVAAQPCTLYLLDFSPEMLRCAKEKARSMDVKGTIEYLVADAQQIPLPDQSVEFVSMAYGIRNIQNPALCAQEIKRVLQPNGMFAILELTRPKNPMMRFGHKLYTKVFLPVVGKWISANQKAYEYLQNSIDHFLAPEELVSLFEKTGFQEVKALPLLGGIATLFVGKNGSAQNSDCKAR